MEYMYKMLQRKSANAAASPFLATIKSNQAAARTFVVIVDESKLCDGLAAQLWKVRNLSG
jgi:ribose 5-phosphate isomerase